MSRILLLLSILLSSLNIAGKNTVVADALSRMPLPNASVFDRHGKTIGICNPAGEIPYTRPVDYPVTIRHIGFTEKILQESGADTIFMQENTIQLPEVIVESGRHKVMHMLAYVREYSTLSTYTDTVSLFREKMVDYMLPPDITSRFKGWRKPRILSAKSYYRFTDDEGLDSVSDRCGHHFSWTDWIGIMPEIPLPEKLHRPDIAADTLHGRYTPAEIWMKKHSKVNVDINVIADKAARKWVPALSSFLMGDIDFERFNIRANYTNVAGTTVSPADLSSYSFNIESNGRGRGMFMFNRSDQPLYVTTYAEIYIIEKEYITLQEAKKWERFAPAPDEIDIYEPSEAPPLDSAILTLIDRVNSIDRDDIRLAVAPDHRLGREKIKLNAGQQILKRLKGIFGIDYVNAKRKWKHQWNDFRRERMRHNGGNPPEQQPEG